VNVQNPDTPNVDELVEKLRARIEERRSSGEYPVGLEEDLNSHFQRILASRLKPELEPLRKRIEAVIDSLQFDVGLISSASRWKGGRLYHRISGRLVARQTQGVLDQVKRFGEAVSEALEAIASAPAELTTHIHPDLLGELDAILERLAAYERTPQDSNIALRDLRRRLEVLESAETRASSSPGSDH